jgi:hypothetical protein
MRALRRAVLTMDEVPMLRALGHLFCPKCEVADDLVVGDDGDLDVGGQ